MVDDEKQETEQKNTKETPLTEEGLRRILVSIFVVAAVGVALGAFIAKYIL